LIIQGPKTTICTFRPGCPGAVVAEVAGVGLGVTPGVGETDEGVGFERCTDGYAVVAEDDQLTVVVGTDVRDMDGSIRGLPVAVGV
jgi:hypothetical protein